MTARPAVGLMIVRAWVEAGSEQPFRAQVRSRSDVTSTLESERTLVSREALHELLEQWLTEICHRVEGGHSEVT